MTAQYLVVQIYTPPFKGYGDPVNYIDMADLRDTTEEAIIRDMISGQYERPVQVLALEPDGHWHDASETIAKAIANRCCHSNQTTTHEVFCFVEMAAGIEYACEMRVEGVEAA